MKLSSREDFVGIGLENIWLAIIDISARGFAVDAQLIESITGADLLEIKFEAQHPTKGLLTARERIALASAYLPFADNRVSHVERMIWLERNGGIISGGPVRFEISVSDR
jgi:hypothetical protein